MKNCMEEIKFLATLRTMIKTDNNNTRYIIKNNCSSTKVKHIALVTTTFSNNSRMVSSLSVVFPCKQTVGLHHEGHFLPHANFMSYMHRAYS